MENVTNFRPFKIPTIQETKFFTARTRENDKFMREDLSRSGLAPEDMDAHTTPLLQLPDEAEAGYVIPYYGLDGRPLVNANGYLIMFRTRHKVPPFSKLPRYIQPPEDQLKAFGLPSSVPYLNPKFLPEQTDELICAEGEKKAASIHKFLGLPVFGIGGCHMWRNPGSSGGLHPWILELLDRLAVKRITVVPDGDLFRYDICRAYGGFARELQAQGYEVRLLNPGEKIDDLLVQWGPEATGNWDEIEQISVNNLVQAPDTLVEKYGLAFRIDSKNRKVVYQHSSNVMRLLEDHPGFPPIWRNLDTNRVMIGDDPATPDLTEMQIANYFQHNIQFDKVSHKLVYTCIQAMAKKNQRSPMLDWVKSQVWDGKPRLDTWMIRLWGMADTEYVREVTSKWLISACARMEKPGTKIDWMLIVVGPQATGKTSMPHVLFKGHNLTLYGDHSDKDLHMLLHSALCVGFDELDSFGKRESSNLKAMITRNEDAFRPPYGASVEVFPRRFTLYGCGNRYEFLQHDPSGYRRYAIVEAPRLLAFAGLEAELPQLWAEAWARYSAGGINFWEVEGTSANAEQYTVANPLQEQIQAALERWAEDKEKKYRVGDMIHFTMAQLLTAINHERDGRNPNFTREIAAILRSLGGTQSVGTSPTGLRKVRYYSLPVS